MKTMNLPRSSTRHSSSLGALTYLTYTELLKVFRVPAFLVSIMLLPIMFFSFFGLTNKGHTLANGMNAAIYMLVGYAVFSVMMAGLLNFGINIALERGQGWYKLLRATALSSPMLFAAKIISGLLVGLASLVLLCGFAMLVGQISLPPTTWLAVIGYALISMLPFIALGLWLGYFAGPNSAPGIANLIFLPMSFCSGLFMPLESLPKFVQAIAPYLPAYHGAQLALTTLGGGDGSSIMVHLLWLLGYTLLFLALAVWAFKRDEGRTFG
jgi:ABC-2 type transport system permease protein